MEQVRVIVEVRGGLVQAVYAGNFVDVLIVDHDNREVQSYENDPVFDKAEAQGYENEFLLFTAGKAPDDPPDCMQSYHGEKTT